MRCLITDGSEAIQIRKIADKLLCFAGTAKG